MRFLKIASCQDYKSSCPCHKPQTPQAPSPISDMSVQTNASNPTTTPCNCRHSGTDHVRIRCGCVNDRPSSHPMHLSDDAFHRIWCNGCLKYCYKDAACPSSLPGTQIVRLSEHSRQLRGTLNTTRSNPSSPARIPVAAMSNRRLHHYTRLFLDKWS
jgi:hypothetical protein